MNIKYTPKKDALLIVCMHNQDVQGPAAAYVRKFRHVGYEPFIATIPGPSLTLSLEQDKDDTAFWEQGALQNKAKKMPKEKFSGIIFLCDHDKCLGDPNASVEKKLEQATRAKDKIVELIERAGHRVHEIIYLNAHRVSDQWHIEKLDEWSIEDEMSVSAS